MKEHICSPDGVCVRERRGGKDTETYQGLDGSLLESLHPFLALSHPYGPFLACSHQLSDHQGRTLQRASEASSKATENGAERGRRAGRGGDGGGVGIVTETPPFFCVPFFYPSLPLSLSLPSVKSCLGAFSATKGRKKMSVALSSSHHPFHPSTRPSVSSG